MPKEWASFAGQRAIDVLSLADSVPMASMACCDGGDDTALVAEHLGCEVASLEERLTRRRRWSNRDVDHAAEELKRIACHHLGRELLSYASGRGVADAAITMGLRHTGPAPPLKARIDNKIYTRQLFMQLGIPTVDWVACQGDRLSFDQLTVRLGAPVVVQEPVGSGGVGTSVARCQEEFAAIVARGSSSRPLLVSAWGGAATLNVNGLVAGDDTLTSAPSTQVTGVTALGCGEAEYCGNDWCAAAEIDHHVLASARRHTVTAGRALARDGFAGLFGMDFVISDGRLAALEINPRLQGSSWLLPDLERAAGTTPIGSAHATACRGNPVHPTSAQPDRLDGAYVVLHCATTSGGPIRRRPRTGVYAFDADHQLQYVRKGVSPSDCRTGELLIGGAPSAGTFVEPGAALARIFAWEALGSPDGRELSAAGSRAIGAAWNLIGWDDEVDPSQPSEVDQKAEATHVRPRTHSPGVGRLSGSAVALSRGEQD